MIYEPYCCVRCGLTTNDKSVMKRHFARKTPCPGIKNDITLTTEVQQYILNNRIYKIPQANANPQQRQPASQNQNPVINIIQNINQYNQLNNIINSMDDVEKLEHYLAHKGITLQDFETKVCNMFGKTAENLDNNKFARDYFLEQYRLLQFVDDISRFDETMCESNCSMLYDPKLKEIKYYECDSWVPLDLEQGVIKCVDHIKYAILNSYERYIMRRYVKASSMQEKSLLMEYLDLYYKFLAAFTLEPLSKDYDEEDDDSSYDLKALCEEKFFPMYQNATRTIRKIDATKMVKQVQDTIKKNSIKTMAEINKRIIRMFRMETSFQERLMSKYNICESSIS